MLISRRTYNNAINGFHSTITIDSYSREESKEIIEVLENYLRSGNTEMPEIKRVIFNDPATIVYWTDNTKTVVKTCDCDEYNKETGLAMAILKKLSGNDGSYYNIFKKWIYNEKN